GAGRGSRDVGGRLGRGDLLRPGESRGHSGREKDASSCQHIAARDIQAALPEISSLSRYRGVSSSHRWREPSAGRASGSRRSLRSAEAVSAFFLQRRHPDREGHIAEKHALREDAASQGAWANINPRPGRVRIPSSSAFPYRYRDLVERFFNKVKHFRAIATRFEKHSPSSNAPPPEFGCGF